MKSRILVGALAALAILLWFSTRTNRDLRSLALRWSDPVTVHGAGLQPDEQNNIDIYRMARTATVYITSTTVKYDFFYRQVAQQSLGSGFLVNEDGFILTNYHVISGSNQIQVTLSDQTRYTARALDVDRSDDLALIKIQPKKKVPSLRLGDSDHLLVGQKVLAIGNPFGLEGTLTTGVVSSIGRSFDGENNRYQGMIQTDAAINGGNSGGPLLDSSGNVIGINTAILGETNIGIGFALPINRAKALLADYQAGRITERPKPGVSTYYVAGDLAQALNLPASGGLLVQAVQPGSAEANAGMRGPRELVVVGNLEIGVGGDLILAIDNQPVTREDDLVRAYSRKRIGDSITLTVYRGRQTVQLKIQLQPALQEQDQ